MKTRNAMQHKTLVNSRVLTTCYRERHGVATIGIISARKSTKVEERQYWRYRNE